jgi:hypothetical protein
VFNPWLLSAVKEFLLPRLATPWKRARHLRENFIRAIFLSALSASPREWDAKRFDVDQANAGLKQIKI